MAKYRKKPVEIEAMPVKEIISKARHAWDELPAWVVDKYDKSELLICSDHIEVGTLEGTMAGGYYDMLIQGVNGEIYPCKPDIFEKTYEKVEK